jgi:hypothetical protein
MHRVMFLILSWISLFGLNGCNTSIFSDAQDDNGEIEYTVHYIGIDIDDVFLSGNAESKINSDDVDELILLSEELQRVFNRDARIGLGYNSGFFDSTQSGDVALRNNADRFVWFNHFPRHQQVITQNLSSKQILEFLETGESFARANGFFPYLMTDYCVTPKHQGIWPPSDSLYNSFEEIGIKYTSTLDINRPAKYGSVYIFPRSTSNLLSSDYLSSQVSPDRMNYFVLKLKNQILINDSVIVMFHQANFAGDRLGITYLRTLMQLLLNEKEQKFVFLPSDQVVSRYFAMNGKAIE